MVTKSELERKLDYLHKQEKECEEYSESVESLFSTVSMLSYFTAGFSMASLYLYGKYGSSFSPEVFSLPKLGFEISVGSAGSIGLLNSLFLLLTGAEYSGLKDAREKRDKIKDEYKLMKEDYDFSNGYT